jgi:hypothetical protein
MEHQIIRFYSQPTASMSGGGGGEIMQVFSGSRRMSGGGFFSSLARFALPLLRNIGGRALRVAARTATDVLDNQRPLRQALVDNALQEVRSVARDINKQPPPQQQGEGTRRRRKRKATVAAAAAYTDIFSNKEKKKIRRL